MDYGRGEGSCLTVLFTSVVWHCPCHRYQGLRSNDVWLKVKSGYRLPCPPMCPRAVYRMLIHKCWFESPTQRPTFQMLAQSIRDMCQIASDYESSNVKRAVFNSGRFETQSNSVGPRHLPPPSAMELGPRVNIVPLHTSSYRTPFVGLSVVGAFGLFLIPCFCSFCSFRSFRLFGCFPIHNNLS